MELKVKIESLVVDGIGGIRHLELSFGDGLNVICGANGIGKTTILDIISDAFSSNIMSKLKRNALCEVGKYKIQVSLNEDGKLDIKDKVEKVESFQPNTDIYRGGWQRYSKNLLFALCSAAG